MKAAERLFQVLGLVDPALVEEAMEPPARRRSAWKRWGALAACLALVVGLGFNFLAIGGLRGCGAAGGGAMSGSSSGADSGAPADSASGGSGYGYSVPGGYSPQGVKDGTAFLSYAGPVFPLTAVEDPAGLTAERTVIWDLSREGLESGDPMERGVEVTDAYTLANATDAEMTVTALYPFAGSLQELSTVRPSVTVNGAAAEAALVPGATAEGYENASGFNHPYYVADLSNLNSWRDYGLLLESGEYRDWALEGTPALDLPVTVYTFSNEEAPVDQYPAATQSIAFHIDREKTRIFTYNIHGLDQDGTFRRYSWFLPGGRPGSVDFRALIVLGEDIGDYTLQGYQDGSCSPGNELEGVSCTVIRREMTLDEALDEVYRDQWGHYGTYQTWVGFSEELPYEVYRDAVSETLERYCLHPGATRDLCPEGQLEDVMGGALSGRRVLYLAFPVTVPAGGSVEVSCRMRKLPSFDYGCMETENLGIHGYDLVTRLGSALEFTRQRAALVNTEGVELTGQNFGFDPAKGVETVELDLGLEHYYLEVRSENG